MAKAGGEPRDTANFRCTAEGCGYKFQKSPDRVDDPPAGEELPLYFANCPECGVEAAQAYWERNLMKGWQKATGPRTPEGKARTAKNLAGHPTPEERAITRFNAMKHGYFAKTAKYFPARPGKYPQCDGCVHMNNGCGDVYRQCLKRVELYMKHEIAYEQGKPGILEDLNVELQATIRGIIDDMLLSIVQKGVALESPEWYYDKDGGFHLAKYMDPETGEERILTKLETHPLLKPLIDLVKANGMTLTDHGMTPRAVDEDEALQGYLAGQEADREDELEHRQRQTIALEGLSEMIKNSQRRTEKDPVLLEQRGQEIEDAEYSEVRRDG